MDTSSLRNEHRRLRHLDDVLAGSGSSGHKSVWSLKQFVLAKPEDETKPPLPCWPVRADYGFFNCTHAGEVADLKAVYKQFFVDKGGDPILLHNAAITGKIFDYVGVVMKLKGKFQRLVRNHYPLPTY